MQINPNNSGWRFFGSGPSRDKYGTNSTSLETNGYWLGEFEEAPEASDNNNKVFKYTGETNETYTHGNFYKSNNTTWSVVSVSETSYGHFYAPSTSGYSYAIAG